MHEILIIDDSIEIATLMREMLTLLGYKADVAVSGSEGLKRVHQHEPDLILLDLMMPEMDGWTFYNRLRDFANVPVIFITASDTAPNRARAEQLGETMIGKETTISDLRKQIKLKLN